MTTGAIAFVSRGRTMLLKSPIPLRREEERVRLDRHGVEAREATGARERKEREEERTAGTRNGTPRISAARGARGNKQ